MKKIYVKTIYEAQHMREPNISEYKNLKEAQLMIDACLKWGMGIVSCKIIDKENK